MSRYIEKIDKTTLRLVSLHGIVLFPAIPVSFELTSKQEIAACEEAEREDGKAFFTLAKGDNAANNDDNTSVLNKNGEAVSAADKIDDTPRFEDVGCVATIKQFLKYPDGNARVVVEGVSRAYVSEIKAAADGVLRADVICKTVALEDNGGVRAEAHMLLLRKIYKRFAERLPKISEEIDIAVRSIVSPGLLSDFIACNILVNVSDKQKILKEFDPIKRIEKLIRILSEEEEIVKTEADIRKKVQDSIDSRQREYYLREQLRVIQGELGMGSGGDFSDGEYDEEDSEINEYMAKIKKADLPEEVFAKLENETKKLAKTPYNSAEAGVIRNYLDVCLDLPWNRKSDDTLDIALAKKILDKDHDGLEKVKERILEYLAVRQLNPELRHQVICLVGPPGTGKTSVVQSIAKAMNRKYVRVSLGGIRDESDIRGHRKTYIGSMPGRIITAVANSGVKNPLILLDEIDKLTHDAHGDPASALLEVLDSEQNRSFRDHFVELPFDLSECMFIATANVLDTIPRPLVDRMEIIELKTYTRHEKAAIAKNHLIPKQRKRHGLKAKDLKFDETAVFEMIDYYTSEAGVRLLDREIATICRKVAKHIVETDSVGEQLDEKNAESSKGKGRSVKITAKNVQQWLGGRKYLPEKIENTDEVGEVNGLAYTESGGDMLKIEAATMPGSGKLELTGSLGDIMKESAYAAVTYIRSHSSELGIEEDFYKTKDIHIHVPEGAVPKDGPSAGVTIITALASELSGRSVKRDIAMTGEITLRGKVLAIGGLREKTMAAYRAGIKSVLIPKDNLKDLDDIDPVVRKAIRFVPCEKVDEVLKEAFADGINS